MSSLWAAFCLSCISFRTWQGTQQSTTHFATGETLWTFTKTWSTSCAKSISYDEAWRNLNGWNQSISFKRLIRTAIHLDFGGREVEKTTRFLLFAYTLVRISSLNYNTFQCTKVWAIEQLRRRKVGERNRIFKKHSTEALQEWVSGNYWEISHSSKEEQVINILFKSAQQQHTVWQNWESRGEMQQELGFQQDQDFLFEPNEPADISSLTGQWIKSGYKVGLKKRGGKKEWLTSNRRQTPPASFSAAWRQVCPGQSLGGPRRDIC